MTTLTDWLLAQVAADEEVARAATKGPWIDDHDSPASSVYSATEDVYVTDPTNWDACGTDSAHIALNDPAHKLRQCEALRKAAVRCDRVGALTPSEHLARGVLIALAEIYADRPGFGEWDS